jgi:hypothetical protein
LVPNPYTILANIPPVTTHFSVLDLKDAFFYYHPQGKLNAYYVGSNFCLHIPDPWDSKWTNGVIAKGYAHGASSYPSTTFKI